MLESISKFELYEPFHAMYQKVLEERRENAWNPRKTSPNPQSYTSALSAVRWVRVYTWLCEALRKLYL